MSTLYLVRHGQASALEADYDKLSSRGEEQARLLGRHLAERGVKPTRVLVGPRKRQRDTEAHAARAYAEAAGAPWPDATHLEDLDEHRTDPLLTGDLARTFASHPILTGHVEAAMKAESHRDRMRTWGRVVEEVLRLWGRGEVHAPGAEVYASFRTRIAGAVERVRQETGSGHVVVAFTSGGVIGAAMGHVLGTSHEHSLELGLVVKNASITELRYSGDRVTLTGFNATPHLDEQMVTLR